MHASNPPSPTAQFAEQVISLFIPPTCVLCTRVTSTFPLCHRCEPPLPLVLEHPCCNGCGGPSPRSQASCPRCEKDYSLIQRQRFIWPYHGRAKELIRCMKYAPSKHLTQRLGSVLAQSTKALFGEPAWSHIVPIPCSVGNVADRGFDQGIVLAEAILSHLPHSLPVTLEYAVKRTGHRMAQALVLPSKRMSNARGSLKIHPRANMLGAHILLVDDVITTGATARAAARLLKRAGAQSIDLITLARAQSWYR